MTEPQAPVSQETRTCHLCGSQTPIDDVRYIKGTAYCFECAGRGGRPCKGCGHG